MDVLEIQIPPPLRDVVGVTDAVPELWATAADFANSCHRFFFERAQRARQAQGRLNLYFSRAVRSYASYTDILGISLRDVFDRPFQYLIAAVTNAIDGRCNGYGRLKTEAL